MGIGALDSLPVSHAVTPQSRWTLDHVGPIFAHFVDVQVSGVENLPDKEGFILAPNHISNLDPVAVWYAMATHGYQVRMMAKKEMLSIPLVGAWFRSIGLVPVDRHSHPGASLDVAAQLLADGQCIGLYPEGTLTREPNYWPMKMKTGAARLALDTHAPVIPVAQWGMQDVMARYSKRISLKAHQPTRMDILRPVDLSDLYSEQGSQDRDAVNEATRRIFTAITAGVEALRGGAAPATPFDPATSRGATPAKKARRGKNR